MYGVKEKRSYHDGVAGIEMSPDSYADPNCNRFLRDVLFILFCEKKAHKNFEVTLILRTRD